MGEIDWRGGLEKLGQPSGRQSCVSADERRPWKVVDERSNIKVGLNSARAWGREGRLPGLVWTPGGEGKGALAIPVLDFSHDSFLS